MVTTPTPPRGYGAFWGSLNSRIPPPRSDSTEPNATLWDNAVLLSAPIRYEPDLFLSR